MSDQVAMHTEPLQMVLDQQQRRAVPLEAESAQHLKLRAFDIYGNHIKFRVARFRQHFIESPHFDLNEAFGHYVRGYL